MALFCGGAMFSNADYCTCGRRIAYEQEIEVTFAGCTFKIINNSFKCAVCFEQEINQGFQEYAHLFSNPTGREVAIDWGFWLNSRGNIFYSRRDDIIRFLRKIGILSFTKIGNWYVALGSLVYNPLGSTGFLYFVRLEDAVKFVQVISEESQQKRWEFVRIESVLSMPEAKKRIKEKQRIQVETETTVQ